jgi:prevent-host-death family protein
MKTTVSATTFKARCLALLDEIEEKGEPIIITRRGHPVAMLSPAPSDPWKSSVDSWKGRARITGDIIDTSAWDLSKYESGED